MIQLLYVELGLPGCMYHVTHVSRTYIHDGMGAHLQARWFHLRGRVSDVCESVSVRCVICDLFRAAAATVRRQLFFFYFWCQLFILYPRDDSSTRQENFTFYEYGTYSTHYVCTKIYIKIYFL